MIVWVLMIHVATAHINGLTVIDNIADADACRAAKRQIDSISSVYRTTCMPVRKALTPQANPGTAREHK